jgi:hypothetical protein
MRHKLHAGLVILGAVFGLASACKKQPPNNRKPTPVEVVQPAPGAVGALSTGGAAIAPAANGPITDAQVRSYVVSHRVPAAVQATNLAVVSTSFITNQQVSDLLHTPKIGVADQEPMCLVILSGNFVFRGPRGTTAAFPVAVEVFDAQTGRLMQAGGLPSPPQSGAR